MNETIRIRDHGTTLTITYEDCVRYHGRTNIGGVALGFRVLQRAFGHLGLALPEREKVTFRTAFPGIGVRDAVEMVTRAATRGDYAVDMDLDAPGAPEAAAGRFLFVVGHGERTVRVAPRPGAVPEEFIALGRVCRLGGGTPEEAARWAELKEILAATLIGVPAEAALQILAT